jgi:hypothetical protein
VSREDWERSLVFRFLTDGWSVIHGTLSLVLIGLAWVMFNPAPTFPTSKSYEIMAGLAEESTWGTAFITAGVLGLCGLLRGQGRLCRLSAAVLCLAYSGLAWLSFFANSSGVAVVVYGGLAAMGLGRMVMGESR